MKRFGLTLRIQKAEAGPPALVALRAHMSRPRCQLWLLHDLIQAPLEGRASSQYDQLPFPETLEPPSAGRKRVCHPSFRGRPETGLWLLLGSSQVLFNRLLGCAATKTSVSHGF